MCPPPAHLPGDAIAEWCDRRPQHYFPVQSAVCQKSTRNVFSHHQRRKLSPYPPTCVVIMTKDRLRQRARRVAFVGSKSLGFACLESMYEFDASIVSLVVTVDDRDDTRSNFEQIAGLCESHETPIVVANSRADSEDAICSVAPDLCVVSGWYWILGERALKAISGPCIGTHHSLLPQYRGGAPLVWAVINGETQVGTSLFELSAGNG